MDYKKRYEEALEKAREYHNSPRTCIDINVLKYLFPELKESEDERIRKFLHHTFTAQYLCKDKLGKWHGEPVTNILSWLEKQGENNTDKIIERARTEKQRVLLTETNGDAYIDWDCRSLQDAKLLIEHGLEYIDSQFEKQGEQKPVISDDALREGIAHFGITQYQIDNWLKKYIDIKKQGEQKPVEIPMTIDEAIAHCKDKSCGNNACALEHKQLEKWLIELKELKKQKPADKVEPKFKVGDWITINE